jgi:C4-dicarboxylate-specific signal transduction histidine kinase
VNEDQARRLRDRSLAFFGAITAGQSHEVTNVLNIINELAGLQQDLLAAGARGQALDPDRLVDIARRIQFQVTRGETILRYVNRFAHSADVPSAVFDLRETVDRILFLAERAARLRKAELVAELPEDSLILDGNPFCLQQAIFECVEAALSTVSTERRIRVEYAVADGGVEFCIISADGMLGSNETGSRDLASRLTRLQDALEELGGELRRRPDPADPTRITFFVPQRRPPGC